jgi:hypothetical protein
MVHPLAGIFNISYIIIFLLLRVNGSGRNRTGGNK